MSGLPGEGKDVLKFAVFFGNFDMFEAMNSIKSVDVYQASNTIFEKGIFLAIAFSMSSLARASLLLNLLV